MQYRRVGVLSSIILALAGALTPPAFAQDGALPSLRAIRRIYVDKMDNDLDQYIRAEIQKKFHGGVVVVLKPESADAIMAGVSEHQNGTRAAITGRYFGLHDTATGSVSLLDKSGTTVLWLSLYTHLTLPTTSRV
jgi:hypothetical protein